MEQGWDDVFLDLDPQRGIAAGDRWERALNQAALRCEAVLLLISRDWLASDWCLKEFHLAQRLNKRLFGLLIEDIPISGLPAALTGVWQLVPLATGRDHVMLSAILPGSHDEVHVTFSREGLTRLRIGLERAGLDARFFGWPPGNDPRRPPYRGLLPLEGADAGIFFGREAPIIEALDRIRGMREGAAPRLLVLLGASGAGKSSFLRAGLLPRLARDDRNFIALPVIRPLRAAINGEAGLLRTLEEAFATYGLVIPRARIREAIQGGAPTLRPMLQMLIARVQTSLVVDDHNVKAPIFVLAIDQGEELLLTGDPEGAALLELLRLLAADDDPSLLVIITIRSDAYEKLQTAKILEGVLPQILSLTPMPRGAYQAVIEGPATRLKETDRSLIIEPALTQALLGDIEDGGGRDALPLLAFTLERLYLEYGGRGRLTVRDYDALGRIKGSIEAAVERALAQADADARIPADRDARLALLRRGLIPWLAGIDPDTGSPRRKKARICDIPEDAQPLVKLLVEQRLLSTDFAENTREQTIEPAHEALLRQWSALQNWLQEDFAALTMLESVKRAARDWDANAKSEDWLAHRAGRLEDTERVLQRTDLAGTLNVTDRDYLRACTDRENAERRNRTEELVRREHLENSLNEVTSLPTLTLRSRLLYALMVCILISAALALRAYDPWFVERARHFVFDTYQRIDTAPYVPNKAIQIVTIDDESLERLGQWPWPRTAWRDITNALAEKGAIVIGFTTYFTESDRTSPERLVGSQGSRQSGSAATVNDQAFAEALRSTRAVLATASTSSMSARLPKSTGHTFVGEDPTRYLIKSTGFLSNLDLLEDAARAVGDTSIVVDSDGVSRRFPLIQKSDRGEMFSLALEMLRIATGSNTVLIRADAAGILYVAIKGFRIHTDNAGAIYPRFRSNGSRSFIPVWKLLAGEVKSEELTGRMILIGSTAVGLADRTRTPIGALYNIEMYGQVLENMLSNRALWRPSFALGIEVLVIALVAVVLASLINRSLVTFLVIGVGMEVLILYTGKIAYSEYSVLLDVSYPSFILLLSSLLFIIFLYLRMNARRKAVLSKLKGHKGAVGG